MDERNYWNELQKQDQEQAFQIYKVLLSKIPTLDEVDATCMAHRAIELLDNFNGYYESVLRAKRNQRHNEVRAAYALREKDNAKV
jgi:hypothetical protein